MEGSIDFGSTLRNARDKAGLSVQEVSDYFISKGFKAGKNTIYSWENNNSQPTPDAFLNMCQLYGLDNPLLSFGYDIGKESSTKKAPPPKGGRAIF